MKKRFILTTLLLAALFALCMSAYAADPAVYVGGVGLEPGEYLAVNGSDGVTSKPTGGYAHLSADGTTLTLDNYSYTGEGHEYTDGYTAAIYTNQALNIVLKGNNSLTCAVNTDAATEAYGIFAFGGVSISGGTVNINVTSTSTAYTTVRGIFARTGDVTISGGRVDITATASGSNTGVAVVAYGIDGDVNISGGRVNIDVEASGSNVGRAYGINVNDASISGGTVDITATSNNGIAYGINAYANSAANNYGTISITGGTVDITSNATASNVNGTIESYGLHANNVSIADGTVDITASASGSNNSKAYGIFAKAYANASGTITGTISITGGVTTIDAGTQAFNKAPTLTNTMDYLMGNGFTDQFVVIGPESLQHEHDFSPDYAFDATHHWHPCTKDGCYLSRTYYEKQTGGGYGYDEHKLSDGACTTCGYGPKATADVWVGGMPLQDGQYVSNDVIVTPVKPSGGYAYYADGTLTLNGYSYVGTGYQYDDKNGYYAAIYANQALTIVLEGENSLNCTAGGRGNGIYAKGDVTISGTGKLDITATENGIVGSGSDVNIKSGEVGIDVGRLGIDAGNVSISGGVVSIDSERYDGISAQNGVSISGGVVDITAGSSGISAVKGTVSVTGGKVSIDANAYGIQADSDRVSITDGVVSIDANAYGIQAIGEVSITGGSGTIVGEKQALKIGAAAGGVLTIGDRMEVLGSENSDGSDAAAYDETKRITYKYISFVTVAPAVPADPTTPTITNPVPENATVSEDGTVTVPAEGGSVSYPATFGAGETVTVTVTPDEHEKIASVVINGVQYDNSGVYVIENVTEALDIRVIFVKAQSFIDAAQDQEPSEPEVPAYAGSALRFYDVMPYNSAYDAINFVADRGIMNGTGVGQFSPEAALTRSMMATILWRMEGEPTVWYGGQFDDVIAGQWYSTPIAWANAAGIVEGYGNGVFGLNDSLTHGQLCAMLYRWNTRSYGDIATAWAWAQANGLYDDLAGVSADEAATRAGIAEVLMAFVTRVW